MVQYPDTAVIRHQGEWVFRTTTSTVTNTHYRRDVYEFFDGKTVAEFRNWLERYHREVLGSSRSWKSANRHLKFWLRVRKIYLEQ